MSEISSAKDESSKQRPYPFEPWIEVLKVDVDRTLLRENLRLTPTERLNKHHAMLKFVEACRRAKRIERAKRS